MKEIMTKEEKNFNKLVKCAEEYIMQNAKDVLVAIRNSEKPENCQELLAEYKPKFDKTDNIEFDDIIERFCCELQNQSGRTNAIKYSSYGKNQDNEIFKIVKTYYENNKNDTNEMKWCNLYDKFNKNKNIRIGREKQLKDSKKICELCESNKCENKQNSRNYGWREYSRGLIDALQYVSKLDLNTFKKNIAKINQIESKERITILKELKKQIHSLGDELVYDFFKELCCENLVKPDVHIKYLYKEIIKGEKKNSYDIAEDIIRMCKESNYTPYYIDKILWLCCTGNFHEDGITINAMTRENFILTYYSKLGKPKR